MTNYEIENSIKMLQEDIVEISKDMKQLAEIDYQLTISMNRILNLLERTEQDKTGQTGTNKV